MPEMVTVGFVVFWLGCCLTYIGVMALPALAKNRKSAFNLLLLTGLAGWSTMIGAAALSGFGQAWLKMPASLMFAAIAIALGAIFSWNRPR